jgi:hypothetical protein
MAFLLLSGSVGLRRCAAVVRRRIGTSPSDRRRSGSLVRRTVSVRRICATGCASRRIHHSDTLDSLFRLRSFRPTGHPRGFPRYGACKTRVPSHARAVSSRHVPVRKRRCASCRRPASRSLPGRMHRVPGRLMARHCIGNWNISLTRECPHCRRWPPPRPSRRAPFGWPTVGESNLGCEPIFCSSTAIQQRTFTRRGISSKSGKRESRDRIKKPAPIAINQEADRLDILEAPAFPVHGGCCAQATGFSSIGRLWRI